MMNPEVAREHTKDIAETLSFAEKAAIVLSLRILFRGDFAYLQGTGAIDIAIETLKKHKIIDENGIFDIPPKIWVFINADIKQL